MMTIEPDKMHSFGPPLLDPSVISTIGKVVELFKVFLCITSSNSPTSSNSSNGFSWYVDCSSVLVVMDASTALEAAWAQNLGHMVNSWCCWVLPLRNTANSLVFDGFVYSSFVHVSWKACGRQVFKCHFIVQRGN